MKLNSIKLVLVTIIFSLASALLVFAADQPTKEVKLSKKEVKALIANAKTPEDHLKLAAYYRKEAQRQEATANYHDEMAKIYQEHPLQNDAKMPMRMANHCKAFADSARQAVAAANSMADEHEKMAQELRNSK